MHSLTKIVATLGPSTDDEKTIKRLIASGMKVARINCSHGDWETRKKRVKLIRKAAKELGAAVAILIDLQGPKIRTSRQMPEEGVVVEKGEQVVFITKEGTEDYESSLKRIPVRNYPEFCTEVNVGERILLDDGLIRMTATKVENDEVLATVSVGGLIKRSKGVNLPDSEQLSVKAITEQDEADLKEAVALEVEYIALSFVRNPDDIVQLKKLIDKAKPKSPIKIMAKIEKPQALECLDEILDEIDAVMVARGDLGVELEPEKVPLAQKEIISKANSKNKLVVTATQMMESMINNPFPTRAEVSDVANAIIDGTDAVMLSAETASGSYPVESIEYMSRIALEVERKAQIKSVELNLEDNEENNNKIALAQGIEKLANLRQIKNIVAFSCSGASVQLISKLRPGVRIIAATTYQHTHNYLALAWGVKPIFFNQVEHTTDTICALEDKLIKLGLVEQGETIIITGGLPIAARASANFIKLHRCDGSLKKLKKIKSSEVQKDLGPIMVD